MIFVRQSTAVGAAAFIAGAALALLAFPSSVAYIAGMPDPGPLRPPDSLASSGHETPLALLAERDVIELKVPEAIRLDRFLDLNRLRRQRRQIRSQLSLPPATGDDQFVIPAGTTFKLRLTPEAVDIPATTATGGSK